MADLIQPQALAALPDAIDAHVSAGNVIYDFLQAEDALLRVVLEQSADSALSPQGAAFDNPEFGILPFLAKNMDAPQVSPLLPDEAKTLLKLADDKGLIPPPTITMDAFSAFADTFAEFAYIGADGTAYGFAPYEQLNVHWVLCIVNGLLTEFVHGKAHFGADMPEPICMPDGEVTLAIAGDWGTAEGGAVAVRGAITSPKAPDYLIHLGDVYYTGTPKLSEKFYFGPGTEQSNLVDFWPDIGTGISFTMNSNHKMYPGAWGLFDDALSSATFAHMQNKSYFLLQNSTWQIFGLDSAYNSPDFMYMYGALCQQQIEFVQKYRDTKRRAILMTHHNPYDLTGTKKRVKDGGSLLQDVTTAFSGTLPEYWYFGHEHNGIVYNDTAGTLGCKMRCTGHASMPYGAPWGLVTERATTPPYKAGDYISTVDFAASTPLEPSDPKGLVKNGFMRITLGENGITEAFFDQDNTQTWSNEPA
ncbi:hypothetical protein AIOL_004615 [Candidatus Rhodobacter oscarellae]|uniref:Calcineurin-like phosphoesterase domain-containing protein n=1 Tax=Candidatus Rhodobacter oscarellae TaxID=1675527 RepID=A0A0J9H1N8_9RHOB|nr:hypothetical protein [Candidatus Rhodobacter lobularis]KMW59633.1 hypothetical protein AIOL_004615 [Candidatus Rhodobacter lobularis]